MVTPLMTPRSSIPLSATFVRMTKEPGAYGDGYGGHGLTLRVKKRVGSANKVRKHWVQRLRIGGRQVNIGLGAYPLVSLAEARKKALDNRRAVDQGRDPREKPAEIPTFAEAADLVIELHRPTWRNPTLEERIWRQRLRDYVLPVLGDKRVNEITPADVLAVLTPVWLTKQETGRRLRRLIRAIMSWACGQNYREDNPAGDSISQALPRAKGPKRHYPALHYRDVPEAIATVQASNAYPTTKLCFEFLVLTATRSGEARLATWEEIDIDTATWTIPPPRMKAGRTHRVPLSDRAIAILREAQSIHDGSGLIFPSARGKALSNVTLSKLMKDHHIPAVPHGFRASFRTWAEETTGSSRAVMEAALAHRLGDAAEQAYARSDLFQKRARLMCAWSRFLMGSGKIKDSPEIF